MTSVVGAIGAAVAMVLMVGCSDPRLEKAKAEVKRAEEAVRAAEKDLDDARGRLSALSRAGQAAFSASAAKEYDALAVAGAAGTTEQLIAIKKHLDEQARRSKLTAAERKAQADVEASRAAWESGMTQLEGLQVRLERMRQELS